MSEPLRTVVRRAEIEAKPSNAADVLPGRSVPPSGPADPKQHVGNGLRSPQPYEDLRVTPNLTGYYFEKEGRYRLLVNHAGPHLEALLTLVTTHDRYNRVAKSPADDLRIPIDWGICDERLKGGKYKPIAFRIAGDHNFGPYYLYVPSWIGEYDRVEYQAGSAVGQLEVTGDDMVRITLYEEFRKRWPEHAGLEESIAIRVDRSPVLLDRYMTYASVPWEVRTRLWFPTTPIQRSKMPEMAARIVSHRVGVDAHMRPTKGGDEVTLGDLLYEARRLGTERPDTIRGNNIADSVNVLVKEVFVYPQALPVTKGGFGVAHLEEMRGLVYRLLNATYLQATDGYPRENMATVMQRTLDRAESDATDLRAIDKYLGVGARGARHHELKVRFTALDLVDLDKFLEKLGAELRKKLEKALEEASERFKKLKKVMKYLPVSTYIGVLEVQYESPPDLFPRMPGWKADFGMLLGGVALSKKAGAKPKIELEGTGLCFSASPPRPPQLEGTAGYFRGDLFAGARADHFFGLDVQIGGGKSGLFLYGDGSPGAGMHLLLDGEFGDVSAGIGVGIDSTLGQVWLTSSEGGGDIEWLPEATTPVEFSGYWSKHIGELAVFFPVNGARLPVPTPREEDLMKEYGRLSVHQALQAFAACELPLLTNPLASIRLEGHADRPDDIPRNRELSAQRAVSVANYLEGLLGPDVGSRVEVVGLGEPPGGDQKKFDQDWRRVDLRVELQGPVSSAEETAAPPIDAIRFDLRQRSLK